MPNTATCFSNFDLDYLAQRFARWQHPVVRDSSLDFLAGSGSVGQCRDLLQLLEVFLIEPTPDHALEPDKKDPYQGLHEQFVGSLHELLGLPERDRIQRERLTQCLLLSVEPIFYKFLAIFQEDEHRRLAGKGLVTVLVSLRRSGCLPCFENLSDKNFQSPIGWQDRSSYHNALRDVVPGRLDEAHSAKHSNPNVWTSVVVVILGLLGVNEETFKRAYGDRVQRSSQAVPGCLSTGIPITFRVRPGAPEPLSTRELERQAFRARIDEALQGSPRLELLQCVPGWGKTTFLAAALDGIPATVRFVDLKDCTTPHQIAAALLDEIELSEDETDEVDERPLAAVKILGQRIIGRGVVVFTNINKTPTGKLSPALIEFSDRLVEREHTVIMEGWGGFAILNSKLGQGCISKLTKDDLPALHPDEVSLWARRIIGRELTNSELTDLNTFDGHPALLRSAIELLAERYPTPDESASSADLLEVALTWDILQREFQRFAISEIPRIQKSSDDAYLPMWAKAWFGLMPWAVLKAESLAPEMAVKLRWFRSVGLIEWKDESYKVGPWGKVIGIRHCLEQPGQIGSLFEFLRQITADVPLVHVAAQRRHLLRMMVWLPDHDPGLKDLLALLPMPVMDTQLESSELGYYQAPLESEVVEGILDRRPVEAEENIQTSPLPPDLLLELIESAARSNNASAFRCHLETLIETPTALGYCLSGWRTLKSLHTALVRAPLSAAQRCEIYSLFLKSVRPAVGDERSDFAQRGWLARFLVGAADAFLRGNRIKECRLALEICDSLQFSTRSGTSDRFADAMSADTDYRLAKLRLHLEVEPEAVLAGHLRAIEVILPLGMQKPVERGKWTIRLLTHLQEVVRFTPLKDGHIRFLTEALKSLQDLDLLLTSEQHKRRDGATSDQIWDILRQEVARRLSAPSQTKEFKQRIECLSAIVFDSPNAAKQCLAWAEAAASWKDFSAIDFHAFRLSIQCAFQSEPLRKRVAEICQRILDRMLMEVDVLHDSEFRERLTFTCLHYFTNHVIGVLGDGTLSVDSATEEESRLLRAERIVDAVFSKHVKVTSSTRLWEEWCSQNLILARRRNALERQLQRAKVGAVGAERLNRFLQVCQGQLGDHPASAMVGLLIARYLWQVDDIWRYFQRLDSDRSLEPSSRMKVLRSMIDFLSIHLLSPIDEHRFQEMGSDLQRFSSILREYSLLAGGGPQQDLILLFQGVLDRMDDPGYWEWMTQRGEDLLATPIAYWRQVLDVSLNHAAGLNEGSGIADLTDPFTLNIASRIFRFGAGRQCLQDPQRIRLAELSVVAAFAAYQWARSVHPKRTTLNSLQVALALGTALSLSEDGTIFGTPQSHETTKKGNPMTWHDLMHREFQAASQMAVGQLKVHCQKAWDIYRDRFRQKNSQALDSVVQRS
jgi:hypothetical protein